MAPAIYTNLRFKSADSNVIASRASAIEVFGSAENDYANMVDSAHRRINFASKMSDKQGKLLCLSSSFGPQSAVMIQLVKDTGLNLPIVFTNIDEDQYDQARWYKGYLTKYYGLKVHEFYAANDAEKVPATIKGLRDLNAGATIAALRSTQTENRSNLGFVEFDPHSGGRIVKYHPILKWSDAVTHQFIMTEISSKARHPDYEEGVEHLGGVVLKKGVKRQDIRPGGECGLHVDATGKLVRTKSEKASENRIHLTHDLTHS